MSEEAVAYHVGNRVRPVGESAFDSTNLPQPPPSAIIFDSIVFRNGDDVTIKVPRELAAIFALDRGHRIRVRVERVEESF